MASDAAQIEHSEGSISCEGGDKGDKDDTNDWSDCDSVLEKREKSKKKYVQLSFNTTKRPAKKRKTRSNSNECSPDLSDLHSEIKNIQNNMVRKNELEVIMTKSVENAVEKVIEKLKSDIKKEVREELKEEIKEEIKKEMKIMKDENKQNLGKVSDKYDGLNLEVDALREKFNKQARELNMLKSALNDAITTTKEALKLANHNQQYSQKNNIKILNWKEKGSETTTQLKDEFISVMQKEGVNVKREDILAIHRVPSKKRGPRPVVMKFLTSDKRREVITKRQKVSDKFLMMDHVTNRNLELINKLRDNDSIHSAWYFNCNVHAIDILGDRHIFDISDNLDLKLRHIQGTRDREQGQNRSTRGNH